MLQQSPPSSLLSLRVRQQAIPSFLWYKPKVWIVFTNGRGSSFGLIWNPLETTSPCFYSIPCHSLAHYRFPCPQIHWLYNLYLHLNLVKLTNYLHCLFIHIIVVLFAVIRTARYTVSDIACKIILHWQQRNRAFLENSDTTCILES